MSRIRLILALMICTATGCAAPRPSDTNLSRDEKWQADVDYLSHELSQRHKNAFFKCSRGAFETQAATLRKDVPQLADHQVVSRVLRLIAMIGDSHTQAQNFAQVGSFRSLPVVFEWLRDGYYVTRTTRRHEGVLGAKLVRIGSTPIDESTRRLSELFPAENEMQIRRRVPYSLRCPELLHACGLIEGLDSAEYTVTDSHGAETSVAMATTPVDVELRWVYAPEIVPLAEQQPTQAYWYKCVVTPTHGPAMYLAYNTCAGFSEFRQWCERMFAGIPTGDGPEAKRWRLIIDLRRNGGGNSTVIDAIHPHLLWRPLLRRPGKLLVLIGRGTFSSAMMNAIQLRQRYGAVLIGEPTGGSPNSYGEIKSITLPHSKLVVTYSTNYFSLQNDGATTVTPDVHVEPSIDDITAGRDPVLEAALVYEPNGSTSKTAE